MIMRKLNKFALMGAIALTGTAGFTACSSDDVLGENGPSISSGETVKTQFTISVPNVSAQGSRVGEDIAQQGNPVVFRGLQNMRLVPIAYETTPAQEGRLDATMGGQTTAYNPIVLPAMAAGDIDLKDAGTDKYKVYNDVDIPTGINAFVFYGEAAEGDETSDVVNGALDPSYVDDGWNTTGQVNSLKFRLRPIFTGSAESDENSLVTMLNAIVTAFGTPKADGVLAGLLENFKGMTAGSSNNILLACEQLYNTLSDTGVNFDTDDESLVTAVKAALDTYFDKTGASAPYTLSWKTDPNFPGKYNLPDGAVQLTYKDNSFAYTDNVNYTPDTEVTGQLRGVALSDYVYPASLYYWVPTTIRISDNSVLSNISSPASWDGILDNYETGGSYTPANVSITTQSVSLYSPIQYAVASFIVNAYFKGEIEDGGENFPGGGKVVTIPTDGMKLTGILIGGQKTVGWDFRQPATDFTGNDNKEYTIYDASHKSGTGGADAWIPVKTSSTGITPAYSLALETKGTTDKDPETVRFALEFINNTEEEFVGRDGIVPVGGKFYLVGELHSETTADGGDAHVKVFEQDHKTVANVSITSLKNAYNCIPDLRSPRLELGLSVNLKWEDGLVANVTID